MIEIVTGSVVEAMNEGGLVPRDRDVVCMTEAIVARAQGNYASVDDIAADVRAKFRSDTVGIVFPSIWPGFWDDVKRGMEEELDRRAKALFENLSVIDAGACSDYDKLLELKEAYPQANVVAVDYDPGASEVNQLNRIKLMLSTANKHLTTTL